MNVSAADRNPGADSLTESDAQVAVPTKRRLVHVRELDGVRGIAALIVLFHHVCYTSVPLQGWGTGIHLLSSVSQYGYVGVDLFFVLSGFLITSLLIEDRYGQRYYQDFYWKRALRILPLYLVCLLGVLTFYPGSWRYVLIAALFIANFASTFHLDASGPFWTLAIEEQFYLIWPTVVRRRAIETVSRCAVGIGLSAVVLRLVAAAFGHHNYQYTFFHCDGLAMGAWLACRFECWGRIDVRASWEKLAWGAGLVAAAGLLVLSAQLQGSPTAVAYGAASLQTAVTLLAGTSIAFLLVHRGRPFLAIFRSRFLTFFGLISYALYMTHTYIMYIYDHLMGPLRAGDVGGFALRLFAILGTGVAVSLVSRYLLELPAASLRRYVLVPTIPARQSTER